MSTEYTLDGSRACRSFRMSVEVLELTAAATVSSHPSPVVLVLLLFPFFAFFFLLVASKRRESSKPRAPTPPSPSHGPESAAGHEEGPSATTAAETTAGLAAPRTDRDRAASDMIEGPQKGGVGAERGRLMNGTDPASEFEAGRAFERTEGRNAVARCLFLSVVLPRLTSPCHALPCLVLPYLAMPCLELLCFVVRRPLSAVSTHERVRSSA